MSGIVRISICALVDSISYKTIIPIDMGDSTQRKYINQHQNETMQTFETSLQICIHIKALFL